MIAFLPGPTELWVVLLIAMLLFGHRIPGMARSLGSGIVEFKKGLKGEPDPEEKKLDGGASGDSKNGGNSDPKAEG